ncbi:MAG: TonB-dependent receptor [Gammaproteobacteria bacterium]|nr:MAG: TonB-dependent receptor [Gammaproteobacteria bacterium]
MQKIILFLSLVVLTSTIAAQQSDDALENILVTASRTPVPASRVGSSYTVISREDLERRQIVYVTDALRDVPGFSISRAGTFGSQTQLRVRGAEANQVMVLIDGVEANDPALGDEFQFDQLLVTGIDRIEIIRGPQSALWGSDALAGIVNLITTRGTEPFSANGFLEAGSFGTTHVGGHLTSTGAIYDINVSVSRVDTDGSNISRVGDEDDGNRNTTLNLNAGAQLSERTRLEFFARHTDSVRDYDAIDFVTTGLPVDADRQTDATQEYLRVSVATAVLENRWTHRFSVTRLETDNENFGDGLSLGSTAAEKLGFYYQTSLALTESDSHRLTFAVDREEQRFSQRGTASPFGDPNQDQEVDTTGYVLEYQGLELGPFSFSAALRHDDNSDFDDVNTYRVTGSYLVDASGTRLHASLGTGQKSPTFIERFGFFSGEFVGNQDLKPERSEGWEIGFEQSFRNNSLSIAATYFDEQLEDEIDGFVFDPGTFLFTAANRPGKSRRQGIELQFTASPGDHLDLSASYTYTDSTELASLGDEVDELRRPTNMLAVNLNFSPWPRANFNLNVSYNGSQDDIFFPPFPLPSERVGLDSYTLVDLAATYRLTPTVQLIGRIENLLDENYEDVVGFSTPGVGAYFGVRIGL